MSGLERRLERIAAFFRLPNRPYDPVETVRQEGEGTWRRLTAATWLMMVASLAASAAVTREWLITIILGVLLLVALRVSYRLHFRSTSRLLVNWLTFAAALVTGPIFLAQYWPLRDGIVAGDDVGGMGFLILTFMWITAFRAFALRTVRDLVETILPCGSIILLALVVHPSPLVLGCMALVVMAALALLAGEQRVHGRQAHQPLTRLVQSQSSRRAGAFYSWPTLYALVLIVAVFIAWAAARSELSGSWADTVRVALAQKVARWMSPRENALVPDPSVMLSRLDTWPNSERILFRVRNKQPGNYRTVAYHRYTGQWWQPGRNRNSRAMETGGAYQLPMEGSGASRQSSTRVEQQFTLHRLAVGTLPSLFCPVQVRVQQHRLRYDRDQVIRIPRHLRRGDTYSVVSYMQPVVPISRPETEVDPAILEEDLQLPEELPRRVRNFARQVTADAATPFEKAHAIEQELMWNYQYTLSVPRSWPDDFVDHFLFVTKRGFCMHFGSAMVVMCRAIGLPARLMGGFLPGEEDPDDPDLYTVRDKDAHAWPEVYFEGAGWVAFDPTPAAEEQTSGLAAAWKEIVETTRQTGSGLLTLLKRHRWTFAALLAAAVLLAAGIRWQLKQRHLLAWRGQEPLMRVVRAYLRMRRLLLSHGLPDDPALTPRELLALLPEPVSHLRQEAAVLTGKYLQARFGRVPPTAAEAAEAELVLTRLRQSARHRPRRAIKQ